MMRVRTAITAASKGTAARSSAIGTNATTMLTKGTALGVAASTLLGLGYTTVAVGQQQPARETLEEITVTGSRIRRTTDFDTANPTTVVDASFLENLGIVNVGDAVAQLPSNVSNNTPTTTGNSNFFTGSTIANLRGLNPFFGSRTLNLVNNRRFVPTNQGDGVDLNFIPSILIERIDVVTGGASAAYGSGAVSGVNNIFLDRDFEGGKVDVDYYQTEEGDGDDEHVGLAFGTAIGDRAHVVLGFEYQKSDPVGCVNARDWCAQNRGFHQGGPGEPSLVIGDDLRQGQLSTTGVFAYDVRFYNPAFFPPPTSVVQANAAGTGVVPFALAPSPYNVISTNLVPGGDGRRIYQYTNLTAPVDRKIAAGIFTLNITDATRLSLDVSWGDVETTNRTGALDDTLRFISADNAYVQQNPGLQAGFLPGMPFALLNKDWTAQVDSHTTFTTEVKRIAIGLDGAFGESTWTWDTYYQFGETDRTQLVWDNRHLNAYNMAVDAVFAVDGDPTSGIVCRVTREGFAGAVAQNPFGSYGTADPRIADGCVPLNPFGTQPLSQAAHDYSFSYLRETLNYKQSVLAANVSGDVFEGFGAGPVQAAFGVEYREEKGRNIAAEELDDWDRTDFLIQYGESFSGDVEVTEAFAEVNLPLLRGNPGAQLLEFNVAGRYSEYKNQGLAGTTGLKRTNDMTTWKVSGMYDPVEWLRFRGSRSRDSRAANFRELYYGQIIQAGGIFGFCGGFMVDACTWSLEGNADLKPEKADTTTFGIVLSPVDNLQIAADYFKIEITDAIQQASTQRVLNGCRLSSIQEFCDLITTATPGDYSDIVLLRALSFNGSGYEYEGIDFTANYLWNISDIDSLNFRLLATKMTDQNFQPNPGQPFVSIVGQTGTGNSFLSDNQPAADLLATLSATYGRGPLSVTANVRYVSDGKMDYFGITPDDPRFAALDCSPLTPPGTVCFPAGYRRLDRNRVPSYAVWGLSGSYTFAEMGPVASLQVFASIDNLFDKDPPLAVGGGVFGPSNSNSAGNGGTNPVFFDTLGRAYRVGIRTRF